MYADFVLLQTSQIPSATNKSDQDYQQNEKDHAPRISVGGSNGSTCFHIMPLCDIKGPPVRSPLPPVPAQTDPVPFNQITRNEVAIHDKGV